MTRFPKSFVYVLVTCLIHFPEAGHSWVFGKIYQSFHKVKKDCVNQSRQNESLYCHTELQGNRRIIESDNIKQLLPTTGNQSIVSLRTKVSRCRQRKNSFKTILLTSAFSCSFLCSPLLFPANAASTTEVPQFKESVTSQTWDLMNGSVKLDNPLTISISRKQFSSVMNALDEKESSKTRETLQLKNPQLIGAGGGGAVFAFDDSAKLIKISWQGSTPTVLRECQTLQWLEQNHVTAAERCLDTLEYIEDKVEGSKGNKRAMIVVEPYVKDAVASVTEISNSKGQQKLAVTQISQTLVQMLAANTITIDVQPLFSKETGRAIFIDMTEAQVLTPQMSSTSSSNNPTPGFSFLQKTLISSFCSEMVALIPEQYYGVAGDSIQAELKRLQTERGVTLPSDVMEILESQTDFLLDT